MEKYKLIRLLKEFEWIFLGFDRRRLMVVDAYKRLFILEKIKFQARRDANKIETIEVFLTKPD